MTFPIYAEHNHCWPRSSLLSIIKLAPGSMAYSSSHRLWRLSQFGLFKLWFKGVPGYSPLTALNVWKAPPLKQKHKETKHQKQVNALLHLAKMNSGALATLTFLLTPSNLEWKVIGWMIDVLLFYYVDSSTGSQTVKISFYNALSWALWVVIIFFNRFSRFLGEAAEVILL